MRPDILKGGGQIEGQKNRTPSITAGGRKGETFCRRYAIAIRRVCLITIAYLPLVSQWKFALQSIDYHYSLFTNAVAHLHL